MITFVLKNNTPREEKVKYALEGLLRKLELSRLEYRQIITIDDKAEDSGTISTKHLNYPDQLIAQYIRIQSNAFVKWRQTDVANATKMLRLSYPESSQTALETLISCTIEFCELATLFGKEKALETISKKELDADAYSIVLEDAEKIVEALEENKLLR